MDETNEDIWEEINWLKNQIKSLEIRREAIVRHHTRLNEIAEELRLQTAKARDMAEEIAELLEGDLE